MVLMTRITDQACVVNECLPSVNVASCNFNVQHHQGERVPRSRTLTPGESPMHHFGSEVRLAREAAGMSCEALADLVPCNKGTVSRIEAGLSMPDRRFAEVCSETFRNPWFVRFLLQLLQGSRPALTPRPCIWN